MNDKNRIEFAALLHDIGKFYQRTDNIGSGKRKYDPKYEKLTPDDFGQNGAHSKWSADFCNKYYDEDVEYLVLHHHLSNEPYLKDACKIIKKADEHSSSERISSDEKNDTQKMPLLSIFSRINLDDNNKSNDYFIPLKELSLENKSIFPTEYIKEAIGDATLKPSYKKLWSNFSREFSKIDFNNFDTVLALLKKYSSTVPSAVYVSKSDVSLYDHAKTTSALATCRYLFNEQSEDNLLQTDDQNVYLAINGDISGIQSFIYKISSPEDAQSGMSKRLRGRSLYISLLTEAIASKIVKDLDLTSANILFCGGGRFTIIAPNTKKSILALEELRNQLNLFFIENFNSELYLALAYEEICGDNLANFGEVIGNLNTKLSNDKKHKFVGNLKDVFKIEDSIDYTKLCSVCGNRLENNDDIVCRECKSHEDLGQRAANAKYIIKVDGSINSPDFYVDVLDTGFVFKKSDRDVLKFVEENHDCKMIIYTLNSTEFLGLADKIKSGNISFDFKFMGNNVPNINGKPLYFEHLAKISKGSNKLGVLKMDVDNLGKIFSQGFNHLEEKGASISRVSALSFFMELFFSGRINKIIDKYRIYTEKYDNCEEVKLDFDGDEKVVYKPLKGFEEVDENYTSTIYINYSGGDDLLVLGPYDDIIEFAKDFRDEFKQWTCENDSINISGGINISGAKFPIGKAAIFADNHLEQSKECGKNKITLFNEILNWDTHEPEKGFDSLFKFSKELEEYAEDKEISKGFVYSLLKIWEKTFKIVKTPSNEKEFIDCNNKKLKNRSYVPLFKYKLRLIKNRDIRNKIDKNGIKYMPWIKIPVSWVSLRLR